jgi:site-specific recombinase XerD
MAPSTFRHTYSSLLSEYGNDVKVVQELMRHAKLSTTMEIYTHPRMERKREAQSRVVDALFSRERVEAVARKWRPQAIVGFCAILCPQPETGRV